MIFYKFVPYFTKVKPKLKAHFFLGTIKALRNTVTSTILQMNMSQYNGKKIWDIWFGAGDDVDVYEKVIVLVHDKLLTVLALDSDE